MSLTDRLKALRALVAGQVKPQPPKSCIPTGPGWFRFRGWRLSRSKYVPHQGEGEKARRRRRMMTGEFAP